jgi:hypothetical protein
MALAAHLRMVVWSRKLWPHLPEKHDRMVNPAEFLQIYFIIIAGGSEAEGPEKSTGGGGGEWEPIKIHRGNLTYIPKLTRHPSLLPRSRPPSYR